MNAIVPISRVPMEIRVATLADLPFLDGLQKKNNKALGYFPTKQFEGYIEGGHVLVAWASSPCSAEQDTGWKPVPLGYIIAKDRYLKRDELGVIYQLCVAPGEQRKLVGASLVKAVFDRAAYGCRLFCCWCAQDLAANYFWESLGFVPIAFRAGSDKKRRVHIFWQKRIDADPVTPSLPHSVTPSPYWYPFKTDNGAMREDRIVFPIPPGVHWRDIRPPDVQPVPPEAGRGSKTRATKEKAKAARPGPAKPRSRIIPPARAEITRRSALRFGPPAGLETAPVAAPKPPSRETSLAPKAPSQRGHTIDRAYLAAARELRDRWMERVNEMPDALVACGRYEVSRALPPPRPVPASPALPTRVSPRLLPAAA